LSDGDFGLRTDFFNFGASSWMARFYLQQPEWKGDGERALVLYFALQDNSSTLDVPEKSTHGPGGEIHVLDGKSAAVNGDFSLKVRPIAGNATELSELVLHGEPFVDMAHVGELVKSALHLGEDGNFAFDPRPRERNPNFVALQVNIKGENEERGNGKIKLFNW
jgi:hypothetical protein